METRIVATMMQKYPHDVVRFKQITGRVERYIHQFCNSMRLIRCKSCLLQRRRLALLIGVGLFVQRQVIQGFGVSLLDIEVELEHYRWISQGDDDGQEEGQEARGRVACAAIYPSVS